MFARASALVRGPVGAALLAILGVALFIAGDLLGPGVLRPIGGGLALGAYAALVVVHRPTKPRIEAGTEARRAGARHVA